MLDTKTPTIEGAFSAGRRKLSSDLEYQRKIANLYREAFKGVNDDMFKLGAWVEKQQAAGAPVSPSWLNRQSRYLALASQLDAAVARFGGVVGGLMEEMQYASARGGLSGLREETARALGVSGADLPALDPSVWSRIDERAFNASMSTLLLARSPLRQLVEGLGPLALSRFSSEWATGLANGYNPRKIARNLVKNIQGLTQGRAQLIARTEWHRGVRQARSEAFQESSVIKSWIWRAALDRTTCGVCYLMHGTEHPTTETLAGHPGCRCVMIPKTKEWADLGLPGAPNTRPPIEPGASSFRRLPEARQRQLIGKTRLDMFKAGTKLRDMTHSVANPVWGPMQKFKPLPTLRQTPTPRTPKAVPAGAYSNPFTLPVSSNSATYADIYQKSMTWGDRWGHLSDFSSSMREAISNYRGTTYRHINGALRGKMDHTSDTIAWTSAIDEAMKLTKLDSAATLYRGTSKSAFGVDDINQIKSMVGQTWSDPGYFSTATFNSFTGPVRFVVLAPKGTPAIWMSDRNASRFYQPGTHWGNAENEVLLPKNTKMLIEKVNIKNDLITGGQYAEVSVRVIL